MLGCYESACGVGFIALPPESPGDVQMGVVIGGILRYTLVIGL